MTAFDGSELDAIGDPPEASIVFGIEQLALVYTVTAKVESADMTGTPKLTLQGKLSGRFGEGELTEIGAIAMPAAQDVWDNLQVGDTLTFSL